MFRLSQKRYDEERLEAQIANVIDALPQNRESLDAIEDALLQHGCDSFLAAKLSDLFPEACGHVLLREFGATLVDKYAYRQPDGSSREAKFSRDHIWKVLVRRIGVLAQDDRVRPRLAILAENSAVAGCINAALNAGDTTQGAQYALAFGYWPRKQ